MVDDGTADLVGDVGFVRSKATVVEQVNGDAPFPRRPRGLGYVRHVECLRADAVSQGGFDEHGFSTSCVVESAVGDAAENRTNKVVEPSELAFELLAHQRPSCLVE